MIIPNLPIEQYHAHEAQTNTKLKIFRESPLLYKRTFHDKVVTRATSEALKEGAGFDCLLFDGELDFQRKYVTKPPTYVNADGETKPWNMGANVCKAWVAAREAEGRTVLEVDAWSRFVLMREAIRKNPLASALLSQGEPQLTFRMKSQKFGMEVQVRPDWFSKEPIERPELGLTSGGLPYMVDLKTTVDFGDWWDPIDPTDHRQSSPVWKFGYHRQGGFAQWVAHKDVGKTAHFLLISEKEEPFRVGIICLSGEYLDVGWAAVEGDLQRLKACRTANVWPGSPEGVLTINPPSWLLEKAAREAAATAVPA